MSKRRSGRRTTGSRTGRPDRKTLQLCEQVRQTLEYVLTGELDDDHLRMLYVASVEPAPDADRLLVTVVPLTKATSPDPIQITSRLHAHAPTLRAAVAASISRRKVPDLLYRFAETDPMAAESEDRPPSHSLGEEE